MQIPKIIRSVVISSAITATGLVADDTVIQSNNSTEMNIKNIENTGGPSDVAPGPEEFNKSSNDNTLESFKVKKLDSDGSAENIPTDTDGAEAVAKPYIDNVDDKAVNASHVSQTLNNTNTNPTTPLDKPKDIAPANVIVPGVETTSNNTATLISVEPAKNNQHKTDIVTTNDNIPTPVDIDMSVKPENKVVESTTSIKKIDADLNKTEATDMKTPLTNSAIESNTNANTKIDNETIQSQTSNIADNNNNQKIQDNVNASNKTVDVQNLGMSSSETKLPVLPIPNGPMDIIKTPSLEKQDLSKSDSISNSSSVQSTNVEKLDNKSQADEAIAKSQADEAIAKPEVKQDDISNKQTQIILPAQSTSVEIQQMTVAPAVTVAPTAVGKKEPAKNDDINVSQLFKDVTPYNKSNDDFKDVADSNNTGDKAIKNPDVVDSHSIADEIKEKVEKKQVERIGTMHIHGPVEIPPVESTGTVLIKPDQLQETYMAKSGLTPDIKDVKQDANLKNMPTDGSICNDGDPKTTGEHYENGVCVLPKDGSPCYDGNDKTLNDHYEKGVCISGEIPTGPCDDGDPDTIGETWKNSVCQGGKFVDGTKCDDNNPATINDIYKNQVCAGTSIVGNDCDDNNPFTTHDIFNNKGICQGTDTNGTSCDDHNDGTIDDKYVNGVCVGTIKDAIKCDDNNPATINDIMVNGTCHGVDTSGKPCNDNNANTIDDKYINGVCVGTAISGKYCNDGNPKTINDHYNESGTCVGENVEGHDCDDKNDQTINDKYKNGRCIGDDVENKPCDDKNQLTQNDKYHNGICVGVDMSGKPCDDGDSLTAGETWLNGICQGGNFADGTKCDDKNALTENDIYINQVCTGTNIIGKACDDKNIQTIDDKIDSAGNCVGIPVEGITCDDKNPKTIKDTYHDGICAGTNVDGQACDDSDIKTHDDKYVDGVCVGTKQLESLNVINNNTMNDEIKFIIDKVHNYKSVSSGNYELMSPQTIFEKNIIVEKDFSKDASGNLLINATFDKNIKILVKESDYGKTGYDIILISQEKDGKKINDYRNELSNIYQLERDKEWFTFDVE
jgi:hypothetical protein